jgi:hypothetical protein
MPNKLRELIALIVWTLLNAISLGARADDSGTDEVRIVKATSA